MPAIRDGLGREAVIGGPKENFLKQNIPSASPKSKDDEAEERKMERSLLMTIKSYSMAIRSDHKPSATRRARHHEARSCHTSWWPTMQQNQGTLLSPFYLR